MKTTHEWLQAYCATGQTPDDVADSLTFSGSEVEHVSQSDDGQTVFQIEITSNRVDCLGVLGLARELGAATGTAVTWPEVALPEPANTPEGVKVSIDDDALELCPFYSAHVIKGVRIGPSPDWLAKRLEAIGCATVNNIVDITNYVMFEYSQPLHAFDLDELGESTIRVRRAADGEKFEAINHREYKLSTADLVIADATRAVALAGVMGGVNSEISDGTTNVLLESAYFVPGPVKATGRRMDGQYSENLDSESRYRFERGVDPAGVMAAARRATALILEIAGGELVGAPLLAGDEGSAWLGEITLTEDAIVRTLGERIPMNRCEEMLTALGLEATAHDEGALRLKVPSYRRDLVAEIDLIEEIGRIHGLNNIEARLTLPVWPSRADDQHEDLQRMRRLLLGAGFDEVLTDTFVPAKGAYAESLWNNASALRARHPVNSGRPALRQSIVPSLCEVVAHNARRGTRDVRFFEIAQLSLSNGDQPPRETTCLSLVAPSFSDVKGAIEGVLSRVHAAAWTLERTSHPLIEEGTGAHLMRDGKAFALIGMLSKQVAGELDIDKPLAIGEVLVSAALAGRAAVPMMEGLPRFPLVERDLAVIVDEGIEWAQIEATVREIECSFLREVRFFDEFRGKQVPKGKKSIAFSLVFRDDSRTLTGNEVDTVVDAMVKALSEKLSAELRA